MSMSKKDFIALADLIREHNRVASTPSYIEAGIAAPIFTESQIDTLAVFCKQQNPNFMRDRWLDYIAGNCGKNGGAVK